MGMIYEAVHPTLGTPMVIKTIRPELASEASVVDRFFREALAASRIRDERLPQIFDHARMPDGTPYMVMELLRGEDLGRRLLAGPLDPPSGARIMLEVLQVLHKVHGLGIVHRDIKPQNIFLAQSGLMGEVPKLLDFGVAHFVDDHSTAPGEIMGTPLYMALEQALEGGKVDARSDVFAAGVVLFEALAGSGRRPWGQLRPNDYVARLESGVPARRLEEAAPQVPAELADVVHRALQIRAEDRFPDAEAFATALEPFAEPRASGRPSGGLPALYPRAAPDVVGLHDRLAQLAGSQGGTSSLRGGERRHVTALVARFGLKPSRRTRLDANILDATIEQVHGVFERALRARGATSHGPAGATVTATFGPDRTRRDDAERAIASAFAVLRHRSEVDDALAEVAYTVQLYIGVHSGFVTRTEDLLGRLRVVGGETLDIAHSLARGAPPNTVQISRATRDAIGPRHGWRPLAPVTIEATGATIECYELLGEPALSSRAWRRPGAARIFVGRDPSLRELYAHYTQMKPGGRPRLLTLLGPAGIGKSRLLEHFAAGLHEREVKVIRGRPEALQPYGLWVNVLRQLLSGHSPPKDDFEVRERLEVLGRDLEEERFEHLIEQAPVAAALLGLGGMPSGDPESMVLRLRDVIARSLDAASARAKGCVVLILDELHRADPSSLELLGALPALLEGDYPPLIVAADRRGLDRPLGVELHEIPVPPLGDEATEALLHELGGGGGFSEDVRRLVLGRAAGNPLFIEELVFTLSARDMTFAHASDLAELRLPVSLYGMLLARLDTLSPSLREAARQACVFPAPIDAALWKELQLRLGAVGDVEPRDTLVTLSRVGILRRDASSTETYSFRQRLLREAIYSTLRVEKRQRLHALIADALDATHGSAALPRLLHHRRNANDVPRVVPCARLLGQRALELGAWQDAAETLQLACALQGRLEGDPCDGSETLLALANALFCLGRLGEARNRAVEAIGGLTPPEPGADEALQLRCLGIRGRAHELVARVALNEGSREDGRDHLLAAEQDFDRAGRAYDRARVRTRRGFVLQSMGAEEEGLRLARKGWQLLKESGDQANIARAGHDLGNLLRDAGDLDEAISVLDRAVEAGEDLARIGDVGRAMWGASALNVRARTFAALGRLNEALRDQRRLYAAARKDGHPVGEVMSGYHLAAHLVELDRLDEAREVADQVLDRAGEIGMTERAMKTRQLLARITAAAGSEDEALEHLEAAEFLARGCQAPHEDWIRLAEQLVRSRRRLGRPPQLGPLAAEARVRLQRGGAEALLLPLAELRDPWP